MRKKKKRNKKRPISLAAVCCCGGPPEKAVKSWLREREHGLEHEDKTFSEKFISRISSQRPFAGLVKANHKKICCCTLAVCACACVFVPWCGKKRTTTTKYTLLYNQSHFANATYFDRRLSRRSTFCCRGHTENMWCSFRAWRCWLGCSWVISGSCLKGLLSRDLNLTLCHWPVCKRRHDSLWLTTPLWTLHNKMCITTTNL